MAYKCILDSTTKIVVNVIKLEEGVDWVVPEGMEFAPQHNGNIGDTWTGSEFLSPPSDELSE